MSVENIGKAGRCRTATPLGSFIAEKLLLYKRLCYDAKFEIRISKYETIPNDQNPNFQNSGPRPRWEVVLNLCHSDLGFVSDFVLRIF